MRALPVALVLVACSDGSEGAGTRTSISASATTKPSTVSSSGSSTTTEQPTYIKAKPDPSLPRQDIDVKVSYPSSFTEEQVEVVQAWTNYRHVFFATLDPPDPDSPLFTKVTDSQGVAVSRDQRLRLILEGKSARIPEDGSLRETVIVASSTDAKAKLLTCQVDSAVQIATSTGSVFNERVITKRILGVLARSSAGAWAVSTDTLEEKRWPGDEEALCLAS